MSRLECIDDFVALGFLLGLFLCVRLFSATVLINKPPSDVLNQFKENDGE
jgi:hypothetical protein